MKIVFFIIVFAISASPSRAVISDYFMPEGLYGYSEESCSDEDITDYGVTVDFNKISSYELGECEIVDYTIRGNTFNGEWICVEEGEFFVSTMKITKKNKNTFELHDYYDLFLCKGKTRAE